MSAPENPRPRLLLVDISSFFYRAFHAMPDFRSPAGEPTGAIFGVANMLNKLRLDYPADYSACVFDPRGKTFRDDIYPQTDEHKHKIATSFPDKFDQAVLAIEISPSEFEIFKQGIFSTSMDDKWNVFVLDNILYLARSWTNFCIYKIFTEQQGEKVVLSNFHVNRNHNQYRSENIEEDTVLLKKLLQMFLHREDLYSDPELKLPLIRSILEESRADREASAR